MNEKLISREESLAEKSFSTSADFMTASMAIRFPYEISGKTIVDIGAGASSAILELQQLGAQAVAVDYRYQNLSHLQASVERTLKSKTAGNLGQIYRDFATRALREFLESREKQTVAATAGALPFKDESVDFAYSIQAMSTFLLKNRDVFINSVQEALRILKPGGELQIQPWVSNHVVWNPSEINNARETLKYISESGNRYAIEPTPLQPRLVIIKQS